MRARDDGKQTASGKGRASASRTRADRAADRAAVRPDGPMAPQALAALQALQGTAGNEAVVQLLRRGGHRQEQRQGADPGIQLIEQAGQAGTAEPAEVAGQAEVGRAAVQRVLRSGGRPLDDATRTAMEARLGADFSDVRVHSDSAARASATALGARAYTSGNHVVIGDGGADAHTLAHELTHVIQQRRGPVAGTDNGDGLKVSSPDDRFEREAEANARRALSGPVPAAPTTLAALADGGAESERGTSASPPRSSATPWNPWPPIT